jgi:hypothetical protein
MNPFQRSSRIGAALAVLLIGLATVGACLAPSPASAHARRRPLLVYRSRDRNGFQVEIQRRGNHVVSLSVWTEMVCSDGTRRRGGFGWDSARIGPRGWLRIDQDFDERTELSAHFGGGRAVGTYFESRDNLQGEEPTYQEEAEPFVQCGNVRPRGLRQHFAAKLVSVGGRRVGNPAA